MNKINRPTWIELNKRNLKHNLKMLYKINGKNNFFCPMVKANAYGHGDVFIAQVIQEMGFNALGVAMLEEAIHLRKHKIKIKDILIFEPILSVAHLKTCLKYNFIPILTDWEDFKWLDVFFKKNLSKKLKVHIKFNTGMNRLGFIYKDWKSVKKKTSEYKNLVIEGVFTHVHSGEDYFQSNSQTKVQLNRISNIQQNWSDNKIKFHALSSVCLKAKACLDIRSDHILNTNLGSRPGLAIYGIDSELIVDSTVNSTVESTVIDSKKRWQLKPVLSWRTQIVRIYKIKKGETVSYGARWKASQDTTIAVLPVGYADGFRRNLTNNSYVLTHDQRAPIVGTVCMDYIMVDLGSLHSKCKIGDEVILLGTSKNYKIDAGAWAEKLQTNSYEVVTCISNRVVRIVV